MGYVQRSAADEDSGGAVLFLLRAPLLLTRQSTASKGEESDCGTCHKNKELR